MPAAAAWGPLHSGRAIQLFLHSFPPFDYWWREEVLIVLNWKKSKLNELIEELINEAAGPTTYNLLCRNLKKWNFFNEGSSCSLSLINHQSTHSIKSKTFNWFRFIWLIKERTNGMNSIDIITVSISMLRKQT